MNITLDDLREREVLQFPLGVTNYLLTLLGSGALDMRGVASLVEADDFISLATMPTYGAFVDVKGDIATCAITTRKVPLDKTEAVASSCFQLNDNNVLHMRADGKLLMGVEVHHTHPITAGTSSIYTLDQAVNVFRRIVGESYNVH